MHSLGLTRGGDLSPWTWTQVRHEVRFSQTRVLPSKTRFEIAGLGLDTDLDLRDSDGTEIPKNVHNVTSSNKVQI